MTADDQRLAEVAAAAALYALRHRYNRPIAMSKDKLLSIVNDLIATGERLSRVGLRTHQGEGSFGISHTYPADQDEYAQWDASCAHFGHLLGKAGEHWGKALSSHSWGAGGAVAKARLGTLRAIKDAIEKDLVDLEPTYSSEGHRASHLQDDDMNAGQQLRKGFEMMMKQFGGAVTVYRDHGTDRQTVRRLTAKKGRNEATGSEVFSFLEKADVQPGDVIQQQGSDDLYTVTQTANRLTGDVFIKFDALVERAEAGAARQQAGGGIYIGTNYGPVQAHSPHATQHATVNVNHQVLEQVNKIRAAADGSDELDDHDKEEIRIALDRVCDLAKREQNEKTKTSINDKLTTVEKMIGVSTKLAKIAGPMIVALRGYFGF